MESIRGEWGPTRCVSWTVGGVAGWAAASTGCDITEDKAGEGEGPTTLLSAWRFPSPDDLCAAGRATSKSSGLMTRSHARAPQEKSQALEQSK